MAASASDWPRYFPLFLWKCKTEFNKTWHEARPKRPLQICVFEASGNIRWSTLPQIGWYIYDFSFETAKRNSMKLNRKQDRNVLYQVCVFSDRSEKQDGRPGLWLAETLLTSPLKPLNRIKGNLTGSEISLSCNKTVFFGPYGKTRWPTRPLIGWDIFDFSETAELNTTKIGRKQDNNVIYQVYVFRVNRKDKMAASASDWLRHFRLFLWKCWAEFNKTWHEARPQRPLPSLCFWTDLKYKMAALTSDWLRLFQLLLWNSWSEFNETWQVARS